MRYEEFPLQRRSQFNVKRGCIFFFLKSRNFEPCLIFILIEYNVMSVDLYLLKMSKSDN